MTDAPETKAPEAGHPEIPEIPPDELAAMVREASLGDRALQMRLAEYYSLGPLASRSKPRAKGMLELASEGGEDGARIWLATLDLWFGRRPFPDPEAAIAYVRRGAEAGDPEFVCAWGELVAAALIEGEPRESAADHFKAAAGAGFRKAVPRLADFKLCQVNPCPDAEDAARLLRLGAESGDSGCIAAMAELIEFGEKKAGDESEIVPLYRKAADLGDPHAMFRLANIYLNGEAGVECDQDQGMSWLRLAADNGLGPANYDLGMALFDEGQDSEEGRQEALARLQEAAALGDLDAPSQIAILLSFGPEKARDYAEARRWAQRGADLDDSDSMVLLSRLLYNGQGGPADKPRAEELMERAAEGGHAQAAYNLSHAYAFGDGAPKSPRKSLEMLKLAAEKGHPEAQLDYATMLYHGTGGEGQSLGKASDFFRRSADHGHPESMRNLGLMIARGKAEAEGDLTARKLLFDAAESGDLIAQKALLTLYAGGQASQEDAEFAAAALEKAAAEGDKDSAKRLAAYKAGNLAAKELSLPEIPGGGQAPGPLAQAPKRLPKRSRKLAQQMAKNQKGKGGGKAGGKKKKKSSKK